MSAFRAGIILVFAALLFTANAWAAGDADGGTSSSEAVQESTRFDFTSPSFSEVVPVKNASADELYFRAREWFSRAFKSANNVLQMDSKEGKTLIGKGNIDVPEGSWIGPSKNSKGTVNFTISVYLKDGRYKYEISDAWHKTGFTKYVSDGGSLYQEESDGFGINSSSFKFIKSYSAERISSLIDTLKVAMSRHGESEKKNDW